MVRGISRTAFWKIRRNREQIRIIAAASGGPPGSTATAPALRNEAALLALGWHGVTLWECALKNLAARMWLEKRLPRLLEAVPARVSRFGDTFEIRGILHGPSNAPLPVRAIWLKDPLSGKVRLITLIPSPNKKTS